jgi:hypothetical protein
MKTENTSSNKDNIAISTILVAGLLFLASGMVSSNHAAAVHVAACDVQRLETIVVTAPRGPDATLETIVVTAPRIAPHA